MLALMGWDLLCDRCVRQAPDDFDSDPWDGSNYADEALLPPSWKIVDDGEFLVVACPGCLTPDESGRATMSGPT